MGGEQAIIRLLAKLEEQLQQEADHGYIRTINDGSRFRDRYPDFPLHLSIVSVIVSGIATLAGLLLLLLL